MGIFKDWTGDIPQQFQGKEKISVLIGAFAKQMEEVLQVFNGLETETSLETARGQNLDYTGSIAAMSRKDVHIVLRKSHDVEITDDVYRKALLWKLVKNTSDCTYEDIMGAMSILWNTENINYTEDPGRPATILLKMPPAGVDGADLGAGRVLSIKPAGVAVIYTFSYCIVVNMCGLEVIDVKRINMRTQIPFWGGRLLNGAKRLDGTRQLNTSRRYNLVLGIKNSIKAYIKETLGTGGVYINIPSCFDAHESTDSLKAVLKLGSSGLWNFDGMPLKMVLPVHTNVVQDMDIPCIANGSIKVHTKEETGAAAAFTAAVKFLEGSTGQVLTVKTGHKAAVPAYETVGEVTVTYRRNLHYLDGSKTLDGSSLVNAFYRKEDI